MAEEARAGAISFDSGLPKISTPGDVGAASIGLAMGYLLDLILAPHFPNSGVTPGSASVYTSAAVLGFKNIVQAFRSWRREKSLAEQNSPLHRAKKLEEAMALEVQEKLTAKAWDPESRAKELVGQNRESLLQDISLYKESFLTEQQLNERLDSYLTELLRARGLRATANKREADREAETKRREAERNQRS